MQLNPYLHFAGNCEEALKFYAALLGAEVNFVMHAKDAPEGACPPGLEETVLHASFTVNGAQFMAADSPPEHYRNPEGFRISISLADPDKAREIFTALAEGGSVTMPLQQTFWAQSFGMVTDRFGTPWIMNCE